MHWMKEAHLTSKPQLRDTHTSDFCALIDSVIIEQDNKRQRQETRGATSVQQERFMTLPCKPSP
eukprot:5354619-Amphidinium_carterae.1